MPKSMNEPLEGDVISPGAKTPVDEMRATNDEANVRRDFWKTFHKALRYIPFSTELVAAYYCAVDSKTPFHVRATLLAALAYFVLPLDVVPDFIFGLGFSDDITVLGATLMRLRAYITDEHRAEAKKTLDDI